MGAGHLHSDVGLCHCDPELNHSVCWGLTFLICKAIITCLSGEATQLMVAPFGLQ